MNAKIFKGIISSIPDDAEIMVEIKPDEEWTPLKSVSVADNPDADDTVVVYLNFSE